MRSSRMGPWLAVLAVGIAACGGETTTEEPAEAAEEAAVDEVAALAALADYWETHYNMGHPDMVASRMDETGLMFAGTGARLFGRDAIQASLASQIEGASPQVEITQDEALVFGESAVARGTYRLAGNADGTEFANTGYWMSLASKVDGEWKIRGLVSNLDSQDQAVLPSEAAEMPEAQPSAASVAERADYYATHFNLGHPDMVADTYTEDAVTMGSGEAMIAGREAIRARLTAMTDAGSQVDIVPWASHEMDGGNWVAGVGTFTMSVPDQPDVDGHWHALYQRVDGELQLHWLLTGQSPAM